MGSYILDGDRLKLGPLAGSMMACPGPAMSIENAFKAAFAGTLRYAIKGDRLSLTSAVKWAIEADELDMHRGDEQRALTARAAAR